MSMQLTAVPLVLCHTSNSRRTMESVGKLGVDTITLRLNTPQTHVDMVAMRYSDFLLSGPQTWLCVQVPELPYIKTGSQDCLGMVVGSSLWITLYSNWLPGLPRHGCGFKCVNYLTLKQAPRTVVFILHHSGSQSTIYRKSLFSPLPQDRKVPISPTSPRIEKPQFPPLPKSGYAHHPTQVNWGCLARFTNLPLYKTSFCLWEHATRVISHNNSNINLHVQSQSVYLCISNSKHLPQISDNSFYTALSTC